MCPEREVSREEAEDFISVLERELRNGNVPLSSRWYTELEKAKSLLKEGDYGASVETARAALRDYKHSTAPEEDRPERRKKGPRLAGYLLITVVILNIFNLSGMYMSLDSTVSNMILEGFTTELKVVTVDESGNPLQGATISIFRFRSPMNKAAGVEKYTEDLKTGEDGTATLALHTGLFQVWVSMANRSTEVYNISVPLAGRTLKVTLHEEANPENTTKNYHNIDSVSSTAKVLEEIIMVFILFVLALTGFAAWGAYNVFAHRSKMWAILGAVAGLLTLGPMLLSSALSGYSLYVIMSRWDKE